MAAAMCSVEAQVELDMVGESGLPEPGPDQAYEGDGARDRGRRSRALRTAGKGAIRPCNRSPWHMGTGRATDESCIG